MTSPIPILSQAGIKRDGTALEGDNYIDGQWCRFQRGRPRKIGGYQEVTSTLPQLARGMSSFSTDGLQYIHIGHQSTLGQYQVNNNGNLNAFNARTPAAYAPSLDTLWQFDVFFESVGGTNVLVAHPGLNLADIDNSVATAIYAAQVDATGLLTAVGIGLANVSGGIVAIGQYLFTYGSDGQITYSAPNDFSGAGTTANITQQKIVKGFPLRGSGAGPAGLFWSLDSLIRATFNLAGTPDFTYDTLSTDISILSSQGIVEYDGVFYWPGVDRWQMFNGVVREIPNNLNQNWFFDNLNYTQRQKVFGFKVPRYGEIWWCYPRGSSAECTHAVIYNVREQTWYDTQLPDNGRTAAVYAKVYNKPFMCDVTENSVITLWQHETTNDKVRGASINAIASHFETAEITMLSMDQASDQSLRVARIEPDFVQTGNMSLTVKGRQNARAPVVSSSPFSFPDTAAVPTDETIKLKDVRRLMSFRFDSNVQGGNYEMGEPYAHIEPADGRIES